MTDHEGCSAELRDRMAAMGIEVTVSTAPPIVPGDYVTDPFVCPHGTSFWLEPTGEQIAEWVRGGVQ
jgi:hypothetical protein